MTQRGENYRRTAVIALAATLFILSLSAYGAPQNDLFSSALQGDLEGVKEALKQGADVNARTEFGAIPVRVVNSEGLVSIDAVGVDGGETPLILAAWKGHLKVVAYLIEKGADLNATNARGKSALDFAAKNGHKEVIELLAAASRSLNNARTELPMVGAEPVGHTSFDSYLLKGTPTWLGSRVGFLSIVAVSDIIDGEVVREVHVTSGGIAHKYLTDHEGKLYLVEAYPEGKNPYEMPIMVLYASNESPLNLKTNGVMESMGPDLIQLLTEKGVIQGTELRSDVIFYGAGVQKKNKDFVVTDWIPKDYFSKPRSAK